MSLSHVKRRQAFILAEALIALLILGVVLLALEGSLAVVVRSVADSERETVAARLAETQRERAFSVTCATASGADSAAGVAVDWTASASGRIVHLTQTSRYPRRIGERVEEYDALGMCR